MNPPYGATSLLSDHSFLRGRAVPCQEPQDITVHRFSLGDLLLMLRALRCQFVPRSLGGLFHLSHRAKMAQEPGGTGLHISKCPLSRAPCVGYLLRLLWDWVESQSGLSGQCEERVRESRQGGVIGSGIFLLRVTVYLEVSDSPKNRPKHFPTFKNVIGKPTLSSQDK